ncbi:Iron/ascorbate family oxidoreductase [Trichoderma parareesei]|uniref:Iron/ascorbate family oxidoreductase n=1 Tax=Trichoderma parareesei TaxID=858221 RepID=A0A2H2ZQ32_TRIPA|nr:Iron/ascorbate family oxidoreductase [Trichoderma parareesei]
MAEAVGIALSVLPIVIWALEKYSEPLDAYSDYHRAIGTLQANLQIQRMHLEATLQSIGLRHPTPRELADCLRQRFPSHHREIAFIVRQMDEMMLGMMNGLQVDMSRKPLWTTHDSPDRISWEWRRVKRSFRTKKCDKMIRDLRSWNDDLRHLVQSAAAAEPRPPDESHAIQRVRRLYNRGNCESVRRTLRSLHRALQAGLLGDGAACHQVCIELNSLHAGGFPLLTFRIGVLHGADGMESSAAWKLFYAAGEAAQGSSVSDSQPYPFPSRPSTLRSRRSSYSQNLREKAHSIWSKSRDSFKQLPTPRASVEDTSITSIPPLPQKPLIPCPPPPITNLCNALSSPSHTEELFGSLKDPTPLSSSSSSPHEETFFSLSHLSRNHDAIIREISLEKIIATESQRVAPAIQPLSAKRRYGIAASLAWAVLYLADSPWLSQGLDRHKVKLFLQRKQANGFISLSEKAYLASSLCKPTTTSLPSPASSSTSLRHITTTTRRTPKSLIFDLGILLIELAVNQSFSRDSLSAILQHDYRPLKNYLDRVEQEAGIYYFNAAQRCVYGVFLADQGQMDFDLDMFQHEFYSTVVAPLQATYEGR